MVRGSCVVCKFVSEITPRNIYMLPSTLTLAGRSVSPVCVCVCAFSSSHTEIRSKALPIDLPESKKRGSIFVYGG